MRKRIVAPPRCDMCRFARETLPTFGLPIKENEYLRQMRSSRTYVDVLRGRAAFMQA